MRLHAAPSVLRGAVFALALAGSLGGCASVVGLGDLVYDREGAGGSAGLTVSTDGAGGAGGAGTSDTTDGLTTASTGTSGGASTTSTTTTTTTSTGGGGGFAVSGSSADYLALMRHYDTPFWRFDEAAGEVIAADSGFYEATTSESDWDGNYLAGDGTLTLATPGVFADDTAVSLVGGASVRVERQDGIDYTFEHTVDHGSFTITFFAKLDATPVEPIRVASCFDAGAGHGWYVTLGSEVVLERFGVDEADADQSEATPPIAFPADGGFHLVTLEKLPNGGQVHGFLDGEAGFVAFSSVIDEMVATDCVLTLGKDPLAGGTAPALTIDEMAIVPYGLNADQLNAQVRCLQGGSCEPP